VYVQFRFSQSGVVILLRGIGKRETGTGRLATNNYHALDHRLNRTRATTSKRWGDLIVWLAAELVILANDEDATSARWNETRVDASVTAPGWIRSRNA
jgi:hypothetical protein